MDLRSSAIYIVFSRLQSIRTSGLVLLETILFGALLLYFPVSFCSHHNSRRDNHSHLPPYVRCPHAELRNT